MKKINIPLPSIDGIELKNATIDLEKGIVVAEYGRKGEFDKVPNNIEIYRFQETCSSNYEKGDGLHIAFNNNKQLLSTSDGVYSVQPNDKLFFEKVECCLKPIKYEDIKVGDTILVSYSHHSAQHIHQYIKLVRAGLNPTRVSVANHSDISESKFTKDAQAKYYKLTPIQ